MLKNPIQKRVTMKKGIFIMDEERRLERLIEEKIKRIKNYMGILPEIEGFNLYDTIISEVDKALITAVLRETKGNQLKASKILGINRNTLRRMIRRLKIKIPGKEVLPQEYLPFNDHK